MPLDDELMRQQTDSANEPGSSAERAGALRQEQRGETEGQEAPDLRSGRMAAIRAKKDQFLAKLSLGQKSLSFETSKLLQSAWRNIVISWGFSFLYVYAHLFLQQIFGKKLFAPLGEEWLDKPNITVEKRKRLSSWLRIIEPMGVGCLTIVLLIAIIFAFSIPALIVEVFTNPLRAALELTKIFFSWLTGG